MPKKTTSTREFLIERRKALEAHLIGLDAAAMTDFLEVSALLQALGYTPSQLSVPSLEFSRYATPFEAVEALLEKTPTPMTKEAIAKTLCDGGFAVGVKRRYWNVIDAIRNGLKRNGKLVEIDGLISLRGDVTEETDD